MNHSLVIGITNLTRLCSNAWLKLEMCRWLVFLLLNLASGVNICPHEERAFDTAMSFWTQEWSAQRCPGPFFAQSRDAALSEVGQLCSVVLRRFSGDLRILVLTDGTQLCFFYL